MLTRAKKHVVPAAERAQLWDYDTYAHLVPSLALKRGPMLLEVRGLGPLVPETTWTEHRLAAPVT